MEDKDSIIFNLQQDIKNLNQDVHLAATYGKQLYEEKLQLSAKIDDLMNQKECLEQEKHCLQLDLETQIQSSNSLINELEWQRERTDSLNEKFQNSEKEHEVLHKKMENMTKENQYLKKIQEDMNVEKKNLMDKINLLVKQIRNFEEQAEKSICEVEKDESPEIQAQLNTYMLNNKELQDVLSQTQCELEISKKNENHLLQMVRELEEAISEKKSEISTYHAEAKKAKEEFEELQAEIEVLKFDQVDVNRRGNSVFAELDDRRHLVEREYKILRKKYDQFKKDYDENLKELDRARGQVAILQSMASRDYQQSYIDKLEDSLSSARKEIRDLMHKLTRALKSTGEKTFYAKNEYDYLRIMLQQLQEKEKELQNEVVNLTSKNMYDNDKLIETQHLLYKSKEDLSSANQEILVLKLKVKELERGIMHSLPNEPQIVKPKVEFLDGFKPLPANNKNMTLLNKSVLDPVDDLDIIPGEIELGKDGFQQVRKPRKSNRFRLQEFNRIKPEDESTVNSEKLSNEKTELIEKVNVKEEVVEETGKLKHTVRSHSKISSTRRNENCAQQ